MTLSSPSTARKSTAWQSLSLPGMPQAGTGLLLLAGLAAVLLWSVVALRIYKPRMVYTAFQAYEHSSLEAGILAVLGAMLAAATVRVVCQVLSVRRSVATAALLLCAIAGGANGLLAGYQGIYDWSSSSGYLAFLADSTTGLLGTALGLGVHAYNQLAGIDLSPLSHRNNVFVYDGGFGIPGYAITQGNVISNMQGEASLLPHESLHAWQSRAFGPLYQVVYLGWSLAGALFGIGAAAGGNGTVAANFNTLAYEANPWEVWAYSVT